MGLSDAEEIGRAIANSVNTTEEIKQDVLPADILNSLLMAPIDSLKITETVNGRYKLNAVDAFVLDHPVQGELDSSFYKLDGGYGETIELFSYSS